MITLASCQGHVDVAVARTLVANCSVSWRSSQVTIVCYLHVAGRTEKHALAHSRGPKDVSCERADSQLVTGPDNPR